MYRYCICTAADADIFKKQCAAIEKNIMPIKKKEPLIDVDDSIVQEYAYDGNKILVHNCHYLDEVYVESEIELTQFFN